MGNGLGAHRQETGEQITTALRIASRVLAWLPLSWALAVGRGLGACPPLPPPPGAAQVLETRFPGRGRRLARGWLRHAGMSVCEFLRSRYRPDDHCGITVQGLEHLPTGGAVLLCAHFGNFELMGAALSRLRRKVAALVHDIDSPLYRFAYATHRHYGVQTIYAVGGPHAWARAYLRAHQLLADGHIVGVFVDAPVSDGLSLAFLDRPMTFAAGADALVTRSEKPAAALFLSRTPRGHLLEILPLPATEATRAFVDLLNERVRARPEQYMWRW